MRASPIVGGDSSHFSALVDQQVGRDVTRFRRSLWGVLQNIRDPSLRVVWKPWLWLSTAVFSRGIRSGLSSVLVKYHIRDAYTRPCDLLNPHPSTGATYGIAPRPRKNNYALPSLRHLLGEVGGLVPTSLLPLFLLVQTVRSSSQSFPCSPYHMPISPITETRTQ